MSQEVSTVETNQDWDQLLKLVEIILIVETRLFFVSVEIYITETFVSRLSCVEIYIKIIKINQDCQDFQDLLRLFKINQDILTLLRLFEKLYVQKSWQIEKSWPRQMTKSTYSRLRSRQIVETFQKFQVLTDFLISIETFGTGRWCQEKIKISWSPMRLINSWDKLFEIVVTFTTVGTYFLQVLKLRLLIQTGSRQIQNPQA